MEIFKMEIFIDNNEKISTPKPHIKGISFIFKFSHLSKGEKNIYLWDLQMKTELLTVF